MQSIINFVLGNLQFLIYAAVFLVPALGWLSRQLREQAERKRAETERKRRELESLRTGRPTGEQEAPAQTEAQRVSEPVSMSSAPAKASDWSRQGELAQRRQAQLEELRRDPVAGVQDRRRRVEQPRDPGIDVARQVVRRLEEADPVPPPHLGSGILGTPSAGYTYGRKMTSLGSLSP